jgi:hypothetical protein
MLAVFVVEVQLANSRDCFQVGPSARVHLLALVALSTASLALCVKEKVAIST